MTSGCDHHHHDDEKEEKKKDKTLPAACGHTAAAIRHALGRDKHEGHDHSHPHDHDHAHEHHDHHGHSHGAGGHGHHHHAPTNFDRSFAISATLNLAFVGAELTFGLMAHSMALMADAVHNFSDVIGLLMAWAAAWMGRLSPTAERTYGYRGASILAALGNAGLLFLATGAIAVESIQRFAHPEPVVGKTMIMVATLGIAINAFTAFLFWKGQKDDLNIRAAFIHMLGDAGISLGVVIAAFTVESTGWNWLDPAASLVISVIIVAGSWDLAKEALHLSIDGVPRHIDREEVLKYLSSLPGVTEVHDLHIWAMSTTETALTAHLLRPAAAPDDVFLQNVSDELHSRFKIAHATLQVEAGNADNCKLAMAGTV